MYKSIIRPVLFRFNPESVHHLTLAALRFAGRVPLVRGIIKRMFTVADPRLEREVLGMRFPNPVGMAAGFDKNAEAYGELGLLGLGFVEVGTVTPLPQPGNPRPRLFRLPRDRALINRMGFNNGGLDNARGNLRDRREKPIVGVNIGKNTITPNDGAPADYLKLFRGLYPFADYFTVNVSCPNVSGLADLQTGDYLRSIVEPLLEFRRGQNEYRPILVKISPDLDRAGIDGVIEVLTASSLDGIVATNTTTRREGLHISRKKLDNIGAGGLSGGPLTARALETVRYVREKTGGRFPIIGTGGVMTPADALAMLDAGADLVQVYTGMIYEGPAFARRICKALLAREDSKQEKTENRDF